MLFFPLLSNLLLVDHNLVGSLLITLVAFFRLKKTVLKVSNFDIALIIQLVDAALEHNLKTVDLRQCTFFLISKLVDKLTESLVVIEVALIVAHVRVKLDFLLVLEDRRLLSLILNSLYVFLQLLVFSLKAFDFLLTHSFLLV